ncbi:MAG: iron-containing alcohol dehydrogenase [Acidaminococcus sp.]|uniref:iron-containing alcohol dehydrogenase n=1 Tax=Acidaminococcus sp. TaxID=1872103 RepID=UPI0026E0B84F|nr:iron-containing alcohol dehydrogenase [Acidaminococcus sp.]MDO5597109.1 iron-containing alcohol dehydrogenase [Acidaminococcus sp.]
MKDFVYDIPTKVYFGKTALTHVGEELSRFGHKVLLVYGGGSIKRTGLYDRLIAQFKACQLDWVELPGIEPNPRIQSVRQGAALCKEQGCDMVLAAGGGSCMDAGKFIAAGACVDFDPWDFISKYLPLTKALPILTIPTMAATGSEMNPTVVISNMETRQKLGCSSPALRPKVSFLNPELTVSVSRYQTACGSADILSHIMETYFNPGEGMFMLDSVMEGLMKTVLKYAPIALEHPDDYEARANLMWTSTWAINGFTRTCQNHVWACHGLEHELSALYDITHGLGLAIVTPRFLEYCLDESNVSRYVRFGVNVFGLDPRQEPMTIAQQSIRKLADFFYNDLGLPSTLTELGIRKEDFPLMAQKACEAKGGEIKGFKTLHQQDIIQIYEMCL